MVSFVVCWEQLPSASVFCLKLGRRDENSNKCCITATRHDRSSNDNLNVDDSLVVESVQCSLVLSGVVSTLKMRREGCSRGQRRSCQHCSKPGWSALQSRQSVGLFVPGGQPRTGQSSLPWRRPGRIHCLNLLNQISKLLAELSELSVT